KPCPAPLRRVRLHRKLSARGERLWHSSRADPARATPLFTPALCDGSFPCRLSPHHKRLGNCALGCEVGKIRAPTRAGIFPCLLGKGQARKLKPLGTALAGSCMARIGLAHSRRRDAWRPFTRRCTP